MKRKHKCPNCGTNRWNGEWNESTARYYNCDVVEILPIQDEFQAADDDTFYCQSCKEIVRRGELI